MRNLRLSQIVLPAAVGALLVIAGVGVGVAVEGDDEATVAAPAAERAELPPEPPPDVERRFRRPRFPPRAFRGGRLLEPEVLEVLEEIREELAKQALEVAEPILDDAVEDDRISEEQADRIRERLGRLGERRGPFGPH